MSRPARIALWIAGGLAGLLVVIFIAGVLVIRTDWFRNYVREKIVSYAEDATGGKADIGSFTFDWTHLEARLNNIVLHGTEPATAAPLFRADLLQVNLKLLTSFSHIVQLTYLGVNRPQVNVIVYPDGHTNVPNPKPKPKSNTTALEDVVDLAINSFNIDNGSIDFAAQKANFSARGENLRVQLGYSLLNSSYSGNIAVAPLYMQSGANPPVSLNVALPVYLERDKIQLNNAQITTAQSKIVINGEMDHLMDMHTSAHLNANVSLDELKRAAGKSLPIVVGPKTPSMLTADLALAMDKDHIQISSGRVNVGESKIEAAGTLKDPSGKGSVQFKTKLVLDELARLYPNAFDPRGVVDLNGNAKLVGDSDYSITGNIEVKDVSFRQDQNRFTNINLFSAINANANAVELKGLRLEALGGNLNANVVLDQHFEHLHADGRLNGFDIRQLARTFAQERLGYDGVISGTVAADDNLTANGTAGLEARVHLGIAPGHNGVPVSGRIDANYNGKNDSVDMAKSYVALPSSRLDLAGSLGRQVQLHLVSRNLNDFLPAMQMGAKNPPTQMPIALNGGSADVTATVSGKLTSPQIAGHVAVTRFTVQDRQFDRLTAELAASSTVARIENAVLTRGALQAQASATVGLHNWSALPREPLTATASIRNADLADLMALAGEKGADFSGAANVTAQINGTVGNPVGTVNASIVNGTAYQERFDELIANIGFQDQLVALNDVHLSSGTARLNVTGSYQHPRDSFATGHVQLHLASNQMPLNQFERVKQKRPDAAGTIQLRADTTADIRDVKNETEIIVTNIDGDINASKLRFDGQDYGDLNATARTASNTVAYQISSNFAGSTIRANGQTHLQREYPTTLNASINALPLERVLAAAGRKDISATGVVAANAQLSGTLADPHANADLTITNANYVEHFDRIQGRFSYSNQLVDISSLTAVSGSAHVDLTASFTPQVAKQFDKGQFSLHLASNNIDLAQLKSVQNAKPGMAGTLLINADGAGHLDTASKTPVLFSTLNGNMSANALELNGQSLGDLKLTAGTHGGDLQFNLASNLGGSKIDGNGQMQLAGEYPMNAHINFGNVRYANLRNLLGTNSGIAQQDFDALVEGSATISGPATEPEALTGSLRLDQVELSGQGRPSGGVNSAKVSIHNQGPFLVSLTRSVIKVDSAHMVGPNTDVAITGTATLEPKQDLNLNIKANTNLSLLQDFDRDIYASGAVAVDLVMRGIPTDPDVTGTVQLNKASFNIVSAPNGLSNANGVIAFNGKTATIQSLTGESGGGQVTASGTVGFAKGALNMKLAAKATGVRVRYPEGLSTVANAALTLTGSLDNNVIAGTITVTRTGFNSHSDFGSVLQNSSTPVATPSAPDSTLASTHLNVHVVSAPNVSVQTSLAQNVEFIADLRVGGTLDEPSVLGRIRVTQGDLVFFGSKYTLNEGSISFYDPFRIEPVLDVNLETNVQGVDVILTVSGPIDNLTLTHRSDPPLPFNQLVALLASGTTPSDPTIAAHQPTPPPQSMEEMGESALLGQVVANPVANRLQRVFGISQLNIAPAFVTGSELPQARVSLQQQVTRNLTFTYITDLTNSNTQVIRIELTLSPKWSAVATRDVNGEFGIDFFYKRRFH